MSSYDHWLEAPYQRMYATQPPPEIEELLGARVVRDGEPGTIESYEAWEDADEDGKYGGYDLVVRWLNSRRTENLALSEAEVCVRRGLYVWREDDDEVRVWRRWETPAR